jgi:type IV pilus assembly protein PilF
MNRFAGARWIGCMFVCFLAVSCATSAGLEERKAQEEASRLLGEAYLGQGDYTSALREFLNAQQHYSQDPYLQNDLGLAYMAKKELDLAIVHYKKALKIKPDYAQARNNLGTAYLAKREWDTAIDCFKALSGDLLYGTPHFPLSNLGTVYYHKKDFGQSESYYLKALEQKPDFVRALRGLARTRLAMGKVPDALKALEKAIRRSPQSPQLYFDLGHAYNLSRDFSKARHAFGKVLELAPDTPLAEEARGEMDKIGQ